MNFIPLRRLVYAVICRLSTAVRNAPLIPGDENLPPKLESLLLDLCLGSSNRGSRVRITEATPFLSILRRRDARVRAHAFPLAIVGTAAGLTICVGGAAAGDELCA
jgi:hypothetical protein